MTIQPKIYIVGHRGMVGSAIMRILEQQGQTNFVTRTHAELELTNQNAVRAFFESERPDQVYLAASLKWVEYMQTTPIQLNLFTKI